MSSSSREQSVRINDRCATSAGLARASYAQEISSTRRGLRSIRRLCFLSASGSYGAGGPHPAHGSVIANARDRRVDQIATRRAIAPEGEPKLTGVDVLRTSELLGDSGQSVCPAQVSSAPYAVLA
jgi:hypothetical protein